MKALKLVLLLACLGVSACAQTIIETRTVNPDGSYTVRSEVVTEDPMPVIIEGLDTANEIMDIVQGFR